MKQRLWLICIYVVVLALLLFATIGISNIVTVISEDVSPSRERCYVIDAGHGGIDGGATSCTGALESHINLEIATRLNDLLQLLGKKTVMIRNTDESLHTEGKTIAAQKVSDLKERVRIVNAADNPVLVSIHQNYFSDSRYYGAQVFYGNSDDSKLLAEHLQRRLISTINPGGERTIKRATGIYLMEHVNCPAVLIECGFLSNHEEEARLRNASYQKNLCCVIATELSGYSNT